MSSYENLETGASQCDKFENSQHLRTNPLSGNESLVCWSIKWYLLCVAASWKRKEKKRYLKIKRHKTLFELAVWAWA